MKLPSSFIFVTVLIVSVFCDDTTTTVNPITATSAQTTIVTDTTTVTATSQQPDPPTVATTNLSTPATTTIITTTVIPITTSTTVKSNTTTVNPITSTTTVNPITSTTTVNPTTSTTTVNPTTSTTTVNPITSTTTVNPIASTTTVKPFVTTTTVLPTTTSSSDTTTSKPTTAPPVTTTETPEPPTPVEGYWNVTEGNWTCIRADLKVRFRIPVKDHVEYIVLSPNATSNGNCMSSNTTQELELKESEYTLTIVFEKDSNKAYLKNITFTYTLPDSSGIVYNDDKLFTVEVGNSYLCDSSNNINLQNVTMEVFRIRIQSFGSVEDKDFGTAEECADDHRVYDKVSPAVGIVLSVLVVVVLVAYFVERRRSRQKGYRSV